MKNFGLILTYATIGTLMSSITASSILYGFIKLVNGSFGLSYLDCLVIGASMASTDPVATLSIVHRCCNLIEN